MTTSFQAQDNRLSEADFQMEALFIEARVEKQKGNLDKAIELYKAVLKEPKAIGAVQFELSRIYDELEQDAEALTSAKIAASAEPDNQYMQMHLAEMLQKSGNDKAAAKTYSKILSNRSAKSCKIQ